VLQCLLPLYGKVHHRDGLLNLRPANIYDSFRGSSAAITVLTSVLDRARGWHAACNCDSHAFERTAVQSHKWRKITSWRQQTDTKCSRSINLPSSALPLHASEDTPSFLLFRTTNMHSFPTSIYTQLLQLATVPCLSLIASQLLTY